MARAPRPPSNRITILDHNGLWASYRAAVAWLLPECLRNWVRGPRTAVDLGVELPAVPARLSRTRPVDLMLSTDVVLETRLRLPSSARGDLKSAVELMIGTETPFSAEELFVHVEVAEPGEDPDTLVSTVRMVPRYVVDEALPALKLSRRRVGGVWLPSEQSVPLFDLSDTIWPRRRWTRWVSALPVVVIFGVLLGFGQADLTSLQVQNAQLEADLAAALKTMQALTAAHDAADAQTKGLQPVFDEQKQTPTSVYRTLLALRTALPAGCELTRLEFRGADLLLTLRSADLLATAAAISKGLAGWTAAIEGAVVADPTGKGEMGTLRFHSGAPA